jgi:hypothetical protein
MEPVPTPQYSKSEMQSKVTLPVAKGVETTYPFQWLVFRPQAHAIEPFVVREATRGGNTARTETPVGGR